MNLVHYEPVTMIRHFQNEVNRLLQDDISAASASANAGAKLAKRSSWVPAVDIREEDTSYLIIADVPGVEPSTIEVTMEAGVLSIKGVRDNAATEPTSPADSKAVDAAQAPAERTPVPGPAYAHRERAFGDFERRFSLPDGVDAQSIEAKCNHGVLRVTIPKQAAPQPRRIKIQ